MHSTLEVKLPVGDDSIPTICPVCEGEYLHQYKADVCFRTEDAYKGVCAVVTQDGVLQGTSQESNPSARRDGMTISFWCETCSEKSHLIISQHKGGTYIFWAPTNAK